MTDDAEQLVNALAWLEVQARNNSHASLLLAGIRATLDGDTVREAFGCTPTELARHEKDRCTSDLNGCWSGSAPALRRELVRVSRLRTGTRSSNREVVLKRIVAHYGGVPSLREVQRILARQTMGRFGASSES